MFGVCAYFVAPFRVSSDSGEKICYYKRQIKYKHGDILVLKGPPTVVCRPKKKKKLII